MTSTSKNLSNLAPLTVLLAITAVCAINIGHYWVCVEDAFISFRYAEHFRNGLGLVFNEGERVEGYTNFLWVVLLALSNLLGAQIPVAAKYMGAFFTLMVIPVAYVSGYRLCGLSRWTALLPCSLIAVSSSIAMWAGSGMETSLYMTLLTLAVSLLLMDAKYNSRLPLSGIIFGLAALTRPEAAGIFAVITAVAVLLRTLKFRTSLYIFVGFSVIFVPHVIFRLLYYGYPLPNTFYAKTTLTTASFIAGWSYIYDFLALHGGIALVMMFVPLVGFRDRERRLLLAPLAIILFALFYMVSVGGDIYYMFRFPAPYLPWIALLTVSGAWHLVILLRQRLPSMSRAVPTIIILAFTILMMYQYNVRVNNRFSDVPAVTKETKKYLTLYGLWLKKNMPPDTLIAVSRLGIIPFYSGLPTIDMLGLADEHIAHMDPVSGDSFVSGHNKYDSQYVLSRKPDLVVLGFGAKNIAFNAEKDLYTEKYQEMVSPEKAGWKAPSDLLKLKEFRLNYVPRAAVVASDLVFLYLERTRNLIELAKQTHNSSTDPKEHFRIGMMYRTHGLYDESIASLRRALKLDHSIAIALNIAYFYMEANRFNEALEEFSRIEAYFPPTSQTAYGRALTLQKMNRYADALRAWKYYLLNAPMNDPYIQTAMGLMNEANAHVMEAAKGDK